MEPFIGQVMMFAGNFAPRGWALCDGQLLAISRYSALFSILGTTYGGDGVSTFGLPDLRSRAPVHKGDGPGLSPRKLGEKGGTETVTLTTNQIPSHAHNLEVVNGAGDTNTPAGNSLAGHGTAVPPVGNFSTAGPNATARSGSISTTGGGQSHNNMQPYQVLNFVIALEGVYPSRS